ncbi:bacteriocin immunity protein [Ectopseudomonas hydrolytica]|uniref:bacteriocin immunity protein n=1 Tax=Ectopseudomonas hydrolytica TaxID=2493633 RepID=UPI00376EBFB1
MYVDSYWDFAFHHKWPRATWRSYCTRQAARIFSTLSLSQSTSLVPICYSEPGADDSPEGILQMVKAWRIANGLPGFKAV